MEVLAMAPGELLRANFWLVPLVELPALDGEPPPRRALLSPHHTCRLKIYFFLRFCAMLQTKQAGARREK